ncbi:MAG: JDVT-CTERM system glutamic-type intramembrane protease [Gammaproteobacteria bacterium]|nr:JDVT-CTERM system glutamic-type intramembrane protease [Gammaproteobacteria bacterium]MCF6230868.1 JDVT-CTERM system glutamic-type intramembrane protease [Gammaproteobacteria bacterium]
MSNECSSGIATHGGLLRDRWFWLALLLGPLVSGLLLQDRGPVVATALTWQSLLWLVLLYPVLEEWLFRGVIQRQLIRCRSARLSILGFTAANGVTSLLFVTAHMVVQPFLWALLVIFPSLVFGWFRDRYNSILPGVILHACYNFAYFTIFMLAA